MPEQRTSRDAAVEVRISPHGWNLAWKHEDPPNRGCPWQAMSTTGDNAVDWLSDAEVATWNVLADASTPPGSDPAVEMECPSCGAMVQSRLQDQAVISELRKQGWAPHPTISRDRLIDHLTHLRVDKVTTINGEVCINAESMADAIAIVLTEAGIEVRDV